MRVVVFDPVMHMSLDSRRFGSRFGGYRESRSLGLAVFGYSGSKTTDWFVERFLALSRSRGYGLDLGKRERSSDKGRSYAFGRSLRGTVLERPKIRIPGADFVLGKKEDWVIKSVR